MSNRDGRPKDWRGIFASCAIIVAGALIINASNGYDTLGAVFPRTIGVSMIVLALVYVVVAMLGRGATVAPLEGSLWRRAGIFAVLQGWALLLEVLGFLTASLLGYCIALLIANFDRWTPRMAFTYCCVGVTVVVGLFLLFGQVLNVTFPTGVLI